jgi:hypothetical protein
MHTRTHTRTLIININMSSVGAGSNAGDVGLGVQRALIFLSAVVGVFGYIVQARSKQGQYLRETQILFIIFIALTFLC